jgi:hypothetical protein
MAFAGLMVGCSSESDALSTNAPAKGVTFVAPAIPTSTPLPDSILNDGCPVTKPNGSTPPGEDPNRSSDVLGNGAIWVGLYPEGTVVFEPGGPGGRSDIDGSLGMKFWWWRGVEGKLEITGRRLDGDAPPMHGEAPGGYGNIGFQATGLVFPTPGCWEVTGRAGDASLTFVTRVVSFYPPFERIEVGSVTLASCPVTEPNGVLPPDGKGDLAYGSGGVSTTLWSEGIVKVGADTRAEVRDDGSLAVEWWWLRWTTGQLEISGRRLDAPSSPLFVEQAIDAGDGVFRSVLVFPEAGCWEVTARMGDGGLVFLTRVASFD